MSRTRNRVTRALSVVAGAALWLTCAGAVAVSAAIATDHLRVVTVLTGSMAPGIPVDTLVVARPLTASETRVGQVIVFLPPAAFASPGDRPVVHRVASVATVDGVRQLRTQGDANAVEDPWVLDADRTTLFAPVLESPVAGHAVAALGALGLPGLGSVLVLLTALVVVRRIWRGPAPEVRPVTTADVDPGTPVDADLATATR